jgi:hypothetical protein
VKLLPRMLLLHFWKYLRKLLIVMLSQPLKLQSPHYLRHLQQKLLRYLSLLRPRFALIQHLLELALPHFYYLSQKLQTNLLMLLV